MVFQELATGGHPFLGGHDVDDLILQSILGDLIKQGKRLKEGSLAALKVQVEQVRNSISNDVHRRKAQNLSINMVLIAYLQKLITISLQHSILSNLNLMIAPISSLGGLWIIF